MKKPIIPAGQFKAHCLKVMDDVYQYNTHYIITKHNKPIAQLVPIEKNEKDLFGCLKGTVHIDGDIISSIEEKWDAEV